MMHASAVQKRRFTIHRQSILTVENDTPKSGSVLNLIYDLASDNKLRTHSIETRSIRRPQFGMVYRERLLQVSACRSCHFPARLVINSMFYFRLCSCLDSIYIAHGDIQIPDIAIILFNRTDIHAPVINMHRSRSQQPHMTIDTRTGVPTAVLLPRIVHTDSHHILLSEVQVRSNITKKRGIAVWMPACTFFINKDLRVHINALEIETQFLTFHPLIYMKCLPIPSDTRRQVTAIVSGRSFHIEIGFNAPIVRQIHFSP